jgi:hypothetical protein
MRWSLSAAAIILSASLASAQTGSLARLDTQLDSATRVAVLAIVDSARVARLPADILINKALEGAGKRAQGPRIVAAVRTLAGELARSRDALGRASRPEEITAGAHALHAGVPAPDLGKLRQAAVGRQLTTPLTVLTDLVARGVPAATASTAMVTLAHAGLRDADFTAFQRAVRLDIEHGADPAAAVLTRTRGATLRRGGPGLIGGR